MPRYVRLGSVVDILPELVSSTSALPGQDYPVGGVVVGRIYPEDPNKWTRRVFRSWAPNVRSRATMRRNTGNPIWFMSSVAPQAGALFVDTDGRRIQDGDDF